MKELLLPHEQQSGFVICGESSDCPVSSSTAKRTYQAAFAKLGIKGKYDNHDWRATYGTQLKESGLFTSAQVADMMGHADTRMVETVYARSRQEGILKYKDTLERMNSGYARGSSMVPESEVI